MILHLFHSPSLQKALSQFVNVSGSHIQHSVMLKWVTESCWVRCGFLKPPSVPSKSFNNALGCPWFGFSCRTLCKTFLVCDLLGYSAILRMFAYMILYTYSHEGHGDVEASDFFSLYTAYIGARFEGSDFTPEGFTLEGRRTKLCCSWRWWEWTAAYF